MLVQKSVKLMGLEVHMLLKIKIAGGDFFYNPISQGNLFIQG